MLCVLILRLSQYYVCILFEQELTRSGLAGILLLLTLKTVHYIVCVPFNSLHGVIQQLIRLLTLETVYYDMRLLF